MNIVSRFEGNLLRILHFILGQTPAQQAVPLVLARCAPPACLSRTAVNLVQDTLAKGCPLMLARIGGWRRDRFVRGAHIAEGRLWERTPPGELGLTFSRHALDFLMWLTASDPRDRNEVWQPPIAELLPADWLLIFLAKAALQEEGDLTKVFRDQPAFARNPLCRLAYPEAFYSGGVDPMPDFRPWTSGLGACIVEALQPLLERRWAKLESSKGRITDWQALRNLGEAQEQVLDAFLEAVEYAGRLDLAEFLVAVCARLLSSRATAQVWISQAARTGPPSMANRVEMQHAALALVRQLERFRLWDQQARTIGYFDEGYAASQLTKDSWERHGGDVLHRRAQAIIRELDPLRVSAEG